MFWRARLSQLAESNRLNSIDWSFHLEEEKVQKNCRKNIHFHFENSKHESTSLNDPPNDPLDGLLRTEATPESLEEKRIRNFSKWSDKFQS